MRNTVVRARVDAHLKADAEHILHALGLTVSDAINLMLNQVKLRNGLPFEVKIPNELTQMTIASSAKGENVKRFSTPDELFDDLGI